MYFIQEVIQSIWNENSNVYKKYVKEYSETDKEDLFRELSRQKMSQIYYPGLVMNSLASCGCRYRFQDNGSIIGCSMCDYQSEFTKYQAAMATLRLKDKRLYAAVVKKSFENVRGIKPDPEPYEVITGYNFFDEMEFPDEVLQALFEDGNLFSKRPYRYIFEGRAADVTEKRLQMLKLLLPDRSRVSIEFGVEARDEWVRNHWINKGVTDQHIEQAIEMIHAVGFQASADMIIGIPGLTEQQSIDQFVQAIIWLDSLGVDEIVCLPLNRKTHTLQGYIYKNLHDNSELADVGLAQGEHTGSIWLYTVLNAINQVHTENPEVIRKLNLAQLSSDNNVIDNTMAYNAQADCSCNGEIWEALVVFNQNKKIQIIQDALEKSKSHECFREYQNLLNKQRQAGTLKQTVMVLGRELAKRTFTQWDEPYSKLCEEIECI